MTPEQKYAMQHVEGCTLAKMPMLVTLKARADLHLWECHISVKEEDDQLQFSKRRNRVASDWSDEIRQTVADEALRWLEGAGETANTSAETTSTTYILRRHFDDSDRISIIHQR